MKRNDMHVRNIPNIVAAACILHNMCEVHGDNFNDAWLEEETFSQPPSTACISSTSSRAKRVRDALCTTLTRNHYHCHYHTSLYMFTKIPLILSLHIYNAHASP